MSALVLSPGSMLVLGQPSYVLALAASEPQSVLVEAAPSMLAPTGGVVVSKSASAQPVLLRSALPVVTALESRTTILVSPAEQGQRGVAGPPGVGVIANSMIVTTAGDIQAPVGGGFVGIDVLAPVRVLLPQDAQDGTSVIVKDMIGAAAQDPIVVVGAPTIDGETTYAIQVAFAGVTFHRNTVEWSIV